MSRIVMFGIVSLLPSAVSSLLMAEDLLVPEKYQTIQAAIDAANAGDTVLVKPGTYPERIQLRPGITLRSTGGDARGKTGLRRAEATIIDGGGASGDGAGVEMAEGSVLDGFSVRNVGIYDEKTWDVHYSTNGEDQDYDHIGAPGIAGIAATGVNCRILNNLVYYVGYTGIAVSGSEGSTATAVVESNTCYRNMGGGIGAMRGARAVIRKNICYENFYAGIGHADASPTVESNECYGNIRAGIGISEGSSPLVRGNRCYGNRRAGIGIRTGSDTKPVVENNECYDNEYAGIGTREEASPTIRNNKCYRNGMAGIGSRTGATPTITGNECYENKKSGIGQMSGCRTILTDNYLHHNGTSGIGFEAGEDGESMVRGNRVIDNAMVAAGVNEGWDVVFEGNELSREGGLPPIVMVFAGSSATFRDNTIRGGGVAGIRASGQVTADGNRFEGTSFRAGGPPNFAVWGLPGSKIRLSNNEVSGWRHAISADQSTVEVQNNRVTHSSRAAVSISKPVGVPVVAGNMLTPSKRGDVVALVDGKPYGVSENQVSAELAVAPAAKAIGPGGPPPGRGPGSQRGRGGRPQGK